MCRSKEFTVGFQPVLRPPPVQVQQAFQPVLCPPPAQQAFPPILQPPPANSQSPVKWSTGLCGCTDNVGNCCMTFWCPCVTFGRIAEIVDRGSTSCGTSGALYGLLLCFTGCQWIYSCTYRSKMRAQYNLESSPCNDCCLHFCCECCALCQEHRELENKGYDMKIGWELNMERKAQGAMLPPVSQGGMMR